jgi:hypothetical protein
MINRAQAAMIVHQRVELCSSLLFGLVARQTKPAIQESFAEGAVAGGC